MTDTVYHEKYSPVGFVSKCLKSLRCPSPAAVNADSCTRYALLLSRFSSSNLFMLGSTSNAEKVNMIENSQKTDCS